MPTDGPLTKQDLEQLRTRGYIKVRAFTAEEATEMVSTIWGRLEKEGVLRDDPSTWRKPGGISKSVRKSEIFREALSAEFAGVVDQLLGQGQWQPPNDRGIVLYTFPQERESWDVATGWHWHGNPLRNVDGLRDIFLFSFLSKVDPEGGGTILVEGSHHVVCKFFSQLTPEQLDLKVKDIKRLLFASHPWLLDLTSESDSGDRPRRFMEESTDVLGHPLRVVELTGEPGEVYVTNMSALHSGSFNFLDRPRFMTAMGIWQSDEAPDRLLDKS